MLAKRKKKHAKHIRRWQLSLRSAWLEGKTLPDGWDLLLHHHVRQVVVMLGQEESLDDRLSDLKGGKKSELLSTGAAVTAFKFTLATSGFRPSAGIWLLRLGGNPGAL